MIALRTNAPATPITTALTIGCLKDAAIPNITNADTKDAIDLWSRKIGTVSINEFTFGTMKGLTIVADKTAIIASFFNIDFDDLVRLFTIGTDIVFIKRI